MALTKYQKNDVVSEIVDLLGSSKMTVVAKYEGTTVKALQALRRSSRENGTQIKVVKNRLAIKAIQQSENLKDIDTSLLTGMLLYAFNTEDEVASAQALNTFAKTNPTLEFVGAITAEGTFIGAAEVKALATLPGKNQLIAGIINTLHSPVRGIMSGLSGNLHGYLQAIEASKA
jgi:large subunit ribosomal protein L10